MVLLAFDLSGNQELSTLAKVLRTTLAVLYISMPNEAPTINDRGFIYCCFGLLWVLVISVLGFLGTLLAHRERDHPGSDPTDFTTIRPNNSSAELD